MYEIDFGSTLGDLIELAGGVPGGRAHPAILLGGAAGVFVGRDKLGDAAHVRGDARRGRDARVGVVMVFDETADLAGALRRIAAFFRDESCGQCVPCRVGTVRQEELLARLAAGRRSARWTTELALFDDLARAMRDASICGLGQTASSAIESAIKRRAGAASTPSGPARDATSRRSPASTPSCRPARRGCPRRRPPPRCRPVELSIDGAPVAVPAGSTILEACRSVRASTPRRCATSRT